MMKSMLLGLSIRGLLVTCQYFCLSYILSQIIAVASVVIITNVQKVFLGPHFLTLSVKYSKPRSMDALGLRYNDDEKGPAHT